MLELYYNPWNDKKSLIELEQLFQSLLSVTLSSTGTSLLEESKNNIGIMNKDYYHRVPYQDKIDDSIDWPWLFKKDDDFIFRLYTKKQDLLYIVSFLAFSKKHNKEEHGIISEWDDKTITFFLNEFFVKLQNAPEDELVILLSNISFILYKNSNKSFSEKEIKDIIKIIKFYLQKE